MLGRPNRYTRKRLLEGGIRAPATVVEISDRRLAVSAEGDRSGEGVRLIVKTMLRVEPAGAPPFVVHQRFRWLEVDVPAAGRRVYVRFDPRHHGRLVVDEEPLRPTG
jgi:hypothetical protein